MPTEPSASLTGSSLPSLLQRLNRLSSKPPMLAYLSFLLIVSVWGISHWSLLGRALLILIIYSAVDLLVGSLREGPGSPTNRFTIRRAIPEKWILPSSAWISGLILVLVLAPTAPLAAVFLAPVLAGLSKHVLRFRRKHVFNPAAFALVVLGFIFPERGLISWWAAAWGLLPLLIVTLGGIVTAYRVRRWRTAGAFALVYLLGSTALLLWHGGPLRDLRTLILDGTLVFFATVMLIEPVTTAYRPAWLRTALGAVVAGLVMVFSLPQFPLQLPDIFLVALLVGNLAGTAASSSFRRTSA